MFELNDKFYPLVWSQDNQVQLASEVLKVLFNLTCKPGVADEEEDAQLLRLESILKELLLCDAEPPSNKDQLYR